MAAGGKPTVREWLQVASEGGRITIEDNLNGGAVVTISVGEEPVKQPAKKTVYSLPSLTEKEITKYIIGTIADMDIPYTPSSILGTAMNRYFSGLTGEYWQQVRTQVLTVTNEQLTALAPMFAAVLAQGYRAALATESTAKECADLFGESRGLRG